MKLGLPAAGLEHYKSASQRARVATEDWAATNLYCPNCDSDRLSPAPANHPVVDQTCPECDSAFQLKSQSRKLAHRITDAAYEAMRRAISEDRAPNLFVLHYERDVWKVQNLIVVPRYAFSLPLIERRRPLGVTARRAGWVGCSIVLGNIPPDARIPLVVEGMPVARAKVRHQYARLRPLVEVKPEQRGWTLDVLNVVRKLGEREFSLSEVYAYDEELAKLHPANRHIRDKMRQQLQILRDLGLVDFLGRGEYRLR